MGGGAMRGTFGVMSKDFPLAPTFPPIIQRVSSLNYYPNLWHVPHAAAAAVVVSGGCHYEQRNVPSRGPGGRGFASLVTTVTVTATDLQMYTPFVSCVLAQRTTPLSTAKHTHHRHAYPHAYPHAWLNDHGQLGCK